MPGAAEGQATASIRGVVTDPDGRPLAAVRVGVIDQETAVRRETQTDASGRFQVAGLTGDRRHRVVASQFGYQTVALENISPGGEEITITLKPQIRRPRQVVPTRPPSNESNAPGEAAVHLTANLVLLTVSVKDARGHPVPHLQPSDFKVSEDGAPQEIVHFEQGNAPLSVVLLMDTSSSMAGSPLPEAKRAALEFIAQSHPQSEIALVVFNDRVRVVQAFTRDRSQVRAAIHQLTATGGTALYDAVAKAIELMPAAHSARHIIVLLSDGKDEDSGKKFSEVERLVQSSDVVIFAVGEYAEPDRKLFMTGEKYYKEPALEVNLNPVWVLRQLAELSGGGALFPHPRTPLEPFFTLIARELQRQYVLGYIPPARSGEPKFHAIEVRVESAARPGPFTVWTRKGYLSNGAK